MEHIRTAGDHTWRLSLVTPAAEAGVQLEKLAK
jgi:hypothetical protein